LIRAAIAERARRAAEEAVALAALRRKVLAGSAA
jgi:hypothetical protein